MRVTMFKCDACKTKLSEGDESRGRCFRIGTPFRSIELDICRECWSKMCSAVGLDPDVKEAANYG